MTKSQPDLSVSQAPCTGLNGLGSRSCLFKRTSGHQRQAARFCHSFPVIQLPY